ncbi:alpha/beta hydrolase [Muriicola sp. Z0-33]|uniref:alpha/beta hydrolase n=1 Tax=Muriicola sp. Z0-33 TaxID=2816957 RepID=UPI002238D9CC|nr:alpha/beta hydrolase [Muriicola sp. Z0-33]MCW5515186.1 alpha/beta hydrolase [Muriicola sp. Z0-33]
MRKLKRGIKVLLGGYLLLVIMLYFLQEKLIFLPTTLPQNYSFSFSQPFDEIFLTAADDAVLNGLHFKNEAPKGTILYFHGNAGDLSRWGNIVTFFVDKGFDVIVMDYRTYGKSSGTLSEAALYKDGQLFYDYALDHYQEQNIILYGRSLGTGIASKLASQNQPRQLILETPYYSLLDLAIKRFPFLPVKWFLKYQLPSNEYTQLVKCPINIFHGTDDKVVPYDSGERLFNSLNIKQKQFISVPDGEHNNLVDFDAYRKGIDQVLGIAQANKSDDK